MQSVQRVPTEQRGSGHLQCPLRGRLALVTGGARGIGRGIASELRRAGASVVIGDIIEHEMVETVQGLERRFDQYPGRVDWVHLDVSDPLSAENAIVTIAERFGPVDILVNNAGIAKPGLFAEVDPKALRKVLQVDLAGAVYLTRLVLPGMIERRWGRIVNVSSMMAFAATPGFVLYSTAKSGLLGFSESLEREVRSLPYVQVTVVLPPSVRTQSFEEAEESAPRLMRWNLVPPVSVDQVAHRTVRGLIAGRKRVYCGAQSYLVSLVNRLLPWAMDKIIMYMFRLPPQSAWARIPRARPATTDVAP